MGRNEELREPLLAEGVERTLHDVSARVRGRVRVRIRVRVKVRAHAARRDSLLRLDPSPDPLP